MDSTNCNDELNDNEKCVDVDNIVNNCDKLNIKKRERRLSSGSENISDIKREKLLSSDSSKTDGSGDFHAVDDGDDVDKRLTVETVNTNDESCCDGLEMSNPDDDPELSPFDRLKNTSTPSTSDTCARIKIYKNRNYRHHSQTDETTQTSPADRGEEEHIEVLRNVDIGSDVTHDTTTIREDVDSSNTISLNESESEVEEEDDDDIRSLIKQPPKPNWFPVQEIIKRQVGYPLNSQSSTLFQRRCYGSLHCAKRLQLFRKLEKHRGCVNCLNFHHDGSVLASGSDDLKIIIWDWKRGKSLISFDSKHKENVFQCKFLPLSGDLHIVSCARDGQVRLSQISIQEGLRSNRNLFTHRKSCHKLAILKNQPHVILSAGEDGVVMSQDVRESSPTELLTVDESEHRGVIPLYSINAHPLNSYEFCICGQNPHVRTYDQRRCDSPLNTYFAPNPNGNTTSDGFEKVQVSCAVYNHNGSEILASYNDGDIFLFDTNGTPGTFVHRYQGHRNAATIKGVNFFGPKSEFIVSGSDCGNIFLWEKNTECIVNYMSADESGVVNCLEPHPQLPFMCTSGLDWDVKVWMPMAPEDATLPNLVDQLKANKNFNSLMMGNLSEDQMLWLLWRRLYHTENELDNLMNDIRTENADFLSTHSTSSLNSDDSEETEEDFHSGCYNS